MEELGDFFSSHSLLDSHDAPVKQPNIVDSDLTPADTRMDSPSNSIPANDVGDNHDPNGEEVDREMGVAERRLLTEEPMEESEEEVEEEEVQLVIGESSLDKLARMMAS